MNVPSQPHKSHFGHGSVLISLPADSVIMNPSFLTGFLAAARRKGVGSNRLFDQAADMKWPGFLGEGIEPVALTGRRHAVLKISAVQKLLPLR
jgi:hypothetical protein